MEALTLRGILILSLLGRRNSLIDRRSNNTTHKDETNAQQTYPQRPEVDLTRTGEMASDGDLTSNAPPGCSELETWYCISYPDRQVSWIGRRGKTGAGSGHTRLKGLWSRLKRQRLKRRIGLAPKERPKLYTPSSSSFSYRLSYPSMGGNSRQNISAPAETTANHHNQTTRRCDEMTPNGASVMDLFQICI